jgi:hypothetical protein
MSIVHNDVTKMVGTRVTAARKRELRMDDRGLVHVVYAHTENSTEGLWLSLCGQTEDSPGVRSFRAFPYSKSKEVSLDTPVTCLGCVAEDQCSLAK